MKIISSEGDDERAAMQRVEPRTMHEWRGGDDEDEALRWGRGMSG